MLNRVRLSRQRRDSVRRLPRREVSSIEHFGLLPPVRGREVQPERRARVHRVLARRVPALGQPRRLRHLCAGPLLCERRHRLQQLRRWHRLRWSSVGVVHGLPAGNLRPSRCGCVLRLLGGHLRRAPVGQRVREVRRRQDRGGGQSDLLHELRSGHVPEQHGPIRVRYLPRGNLHRPFRHARLP